MTDPRPQLKPPRGRVAGERVAVVTGEQTFTVDLGGTGVVSDFTDQRADADPLPGDVLESLLNALSSTLEHEGVIAGSVDLIAVDVDTIAQLNDQHMGQDGPTDVLSFPLDDPSEGDAFGFRPHVGDIVLCPEVAVRQAPEHAGTVDAELHLLVIHSALHLLGYDHSEEDERQRMQAREAVHMERFGFAHPGDQR